MSSPLIGILGLAVLLLMFPLGIELAFAMAIVGFVGFSLLVSFPAGMSMVAKSFFDTFTSYGFTVIPLFVLMGQIAFNAGIARRLYVAAYRFLGHIPGGLAMATVAGATVFKAICGSSPATAATFASVAVPEMDRYRYDRRLSAGIVATVGTLGILMPPSVTLIVFGVITQKSIGRLFLAGLVPALIIAASFIAVIAIWCARNPALGPKGERSTWKQRAASLPECLYVGAVFLLVIGGLMKGFFTPTEAGSVGTAAVLVLSLARGGLGLKGFVRSVSESLRTACMVLMLIAGSTVLGTFLARTTIPMIAADWVTSLPLPPWAIMALICLIYLIGGSFVDDLAFMVLATPIFFPAVESMGFDPYWFGAVIGVTVMIGVVIPPVAINVFVVRSITKESLGTIYRGVLPFTIALLVMGVLLFVFPQIATYLPDLLMPGR
ncbi:MAG TPA: C4-dicarboxylate ABC transporter permease [Planctomycetes bacterium]|nr:C4-dicarboxylate ABC transporter permease [Planctomycetota bacterium]